MKIKYLLLGSLITLITIFISSLIVIPFNKKEINKLQGIVEIKGYTIIPVRLYLKNNIAKLEIAVAKGKHTYDKKEAIKKRDTERETARLLKNYR